MKMAVRKDPQGLQAHIPNKNTWEGFLPGI